MQSYHKNSTSTKNNTNKPEQKTLSFFSTSSTDNYKGKIVGEINYSRTNPQSLIPKIQELITKIENYKGKLHLNLNHKIKIKLKQGKTIFQDCINFLSKQKILQPLIFKEELCLDFPFENPSICDNEAYLTNIIRKKSQELGKIGIEMINFHYDLFILEPEISVLMQIIDDTNSKFQRRTNIFNPNAKYIGVNIGKKAHDVYCFYITFAKDYK